MNLRDGVKLAIDALDGLCPGLSDPFLKYEGHKRVSRIRLKKPAAGSTAFSVEQKMDLSAQEIYEGFADTWTARSPDSKTVELFSVVACREHSATKTQDIEVLRHVFTAYGFPESALAHFNGRHIAFTESPNLGYGDTELGCTSDLSCRQFSFIWSIDASKTRARALWLCYDDSYSAMIQMELLQNVTRFKDFMDQPNTLSLMGAIASIRFIGAMLANGDLDSSFREKELGRSLENGVSAEAALEYGKISADASWSAAQAIRNKNRSLVVKTFLDAMERQRAHERSKLSKVPDEWKLVDMIVTHLQQKCESLIRQSDRIAQETQSHLSTLYNLISQRDAVISMEIAQASRDLAIESRKEQLLSNEIAEASKQVALSTKRDSSVMIIIASVTVLFLPGTFLASLFDTGFFDWTASTPEVVNPRIWVYWTITAALTLLTIAGAVSWFKLSRAHRSAWLRSLEDVRDSRGRNG